MSIAVASGDQTVASSSGGAGGMSVAISVSLTKQRPSLKRKNVKTTPRKLAKVSSSSQGGARGALKK